MFLTNNNSTFFAALHCNRADRLFEDLAAELIPYSIQLHFMRAKFSNTVSEILSALLILIWVYAAISKLSAFEKFTLVLKSSPLISSHAHFFAISLPAIELLTALLLFIPKYRLWGFAASLILMLLLTGYLGYMLLFVPHLPCSCGGILENMSWTQHLFFNITLTIIAAAGLLVHQRNKYLIAINSR